VALLVSCCLLALVLVPLNYRPWRQRFFSSPLLEQYRRMIPAMSETENTALAAGTVGWEGELFAGKPDWKKLHAIPFLELSVEEQAFLDGPVEELCDMLNQ
jgi:acyl-CoA dehydrogenase